MLPSSASQYPHFEKPSASTRACDDFLGYSDQGEAEPRDKDCVTVDAAVLNVACASFSASPCQEMKEGKNIDSAATTTCARSYISLYCA